jgi:hypothetical protein
MTAEAELGAKGESSPRAEFSVLLNMGSGASAAGPSEVGPKEAHIQIRLLLMTNSCRSRSLRALLTLRRTR